MYTIISMTRDPAPLLDWLESYHGEMVFRG